MIGFNVGCVLAGLGLLLWGGAAALNGVAYQASLRQSAKDQHRVAEAHVKMHEAIADATRKSTGEPPKEPWQG